MAPSIRTAARLVNLPVGRRGVAVWRFTGHMAAMSLRPLLAILLAIGMLLAPLGIRGGAAMAAPATSHHGEMAKSDHCGEQPAKGQHDKASDNGCCIAMCMAVAPAPAHELHRPAPAASLDQPALDRSGVSFLAELPTPPPRLA
jgi:hypothetical protein